MKEKIYQLLLALTITGLVFSPFLASVGMIGIVAISILFIQKPQKDRIAIIWLTLLFFNIFFLVGTDPDTTYWVSRLRVHSPFLLLPLAFLILPVLSTKQYINIHLLFALILVIGCIQSIAIYYQNVELYQQQLKMGQSIPTPTRSHIRFNLMLVYSIFSLIWIWWNREKMYLEKRLSVIIISMAVILFLAMHWLSVRSGLFIFYTLIGCALLRQVWITKSWRMGLIGIASMLTIPAIAFFGFPSFKAKVGYTIYEFNKILAGEGQGYSNGDRIASILDGWKLFEAHPILGIGTGQLRRGMKSVSSQTYTSDLDVLIPHNQWMVEAAGGGIIGLILFMLGFLMPLLSRRTHYYPPFYLIYGVVGISMLFEPTLETAEGIGLFLIFVLIARKR